MARTRGGLGRGPEVHGVLAYLSRPLYPLLRRAKIRRRGPRGHAPKDILLPDGYVAEVVAAGLNTPVHCTFAPDGTCYVTECGFKIEERPRILRLDVESGDYDVVFEWPDERWIKTGAVTGACWLDGSLYVTNTDTLYRLRDGALEEVVTGLPGRGDHETNYPVVGPDGRIYFSVGTATNTGVVGPDNFNYEWLRHFEDVHDVPGQDVVLAGENFESQDVWPSGNLARRVSTGAFVLYGTAMVGG